MPPHPAGPLGAGAGQPVAHPLQPRAHADAHSGHAAGGEGCFLTWGRGLLVKLRVVVVVVVEAGVLRGSGGTFQRRGNDILRNGHK